MINKQPIFIVGAPRSGTTLLSATLANHSQIACGPETQFFNKLNPQVLHHVEFDWPRKAVKAVMALNLSGQPVHELFELTEGEIESYLSLRLPSLRTLLESLTAQYAQKAGKIRWAEKTPNHLVHLPLIRKLFPESPIIRIVRDPRDSAISMKKLPWASQSVLANCYFWNEWFSVSHEFCIKDEKTLTIRYEDFVLNPKKSLEGLCNHIGESFEESMLDTSQSASRVTSPNETWKAQVSQSLDPTRLYVWKRVLSKQLRRATSYACQSGIKAFEYELVEESRASVFFYKVDRKFIEENENVFIDMANAGKRILSLENNTVESLAFIHQDLTFPSIPYDSKGGSLKEAFRIVNFFVFLASRRFNVCSTFYLSASVNSNKSRRLATRAYVFLLRVFATPQ